MNPVPDKETLNRLIELGASLANINVVPDGDPFAIIPQGCKVESLAALYPPHHIQRNVALLDSGSFADYVNRYKSDNTQIFARVTDDTGEFVALLDYHGAAPDLKPTRCAHRAVFQPIRTAEFDAWMKANRQRMGQVDFAVWLEENSTLFKEPTGAELLELVTTLHGHADARFNQTFRLQDGSCKLQYDEDVVIRGSSTTTSKPGELELPSIVIAGIAPFQGAALYEVKARLKVRIENRKLLLWFETIKPHCIIRDSLEITMRLIAEKTGIIPLLGIP